jgi:CHAD domain-containing protein
VGNVVGTQVEVERAFSPDPDADLPDLTRVTGIVAVEPSGVEELDATYYDLPGLPLLRAGVTLRRREGGHDEGWHLKLPGAVEQSRTEVHEGLDHAQVPAALARLVAGWTRGQEPAAVARIRTNRHTSRLVGSDGAVLAELADDRVEGRAAQLDSEPKRWREWEVELVHGEPALLDDVAAYLAEQGVQPSEVQRKIVVVLGQPEHPAPEPASKKGPAGLLLHHWILDQVGEIERLDPVVRQADDGGVHGLRKACRRLRGALATYRPLVDREVTDPIREELRWLARSLGPARDDEVVVERIDGLLGDQDGDVTEARQVLERHAAVRAAEDEEALSGTLCSQRYFELRTALDRLAAEPPWTSTADEPAREVLPALVRKEWKRLRRRHRDAADPHEVRKAAKRLRYAYELLEPVWGSASKPRKAASDLTSTLGDRQDTIVAREWLVTMAHSGASGAAGFVFGRAHAQEELDEVVLLQQAAKQWRTLKSVRW